MNKRAVSHPKTTSKTPSITSPSLTVQRLFGSPQLLEGEDAAAYDELLSRVCAAVSPVDVIDEILIADVVSLEWDVLRGHRWKTSLIRSLEVNALKRFLIARLDYYDHYRTAENMRSVRIRLPDIYCGTIACCSRNRNASRLDSGSSPSGLFTRR
jgi:hypothetical protein